MVRGIDNVSPQKNLRRSGRDRSTFYRSLEENELANNIYQSSSIKRLVGRANELRDREMNSHTRSGFTRSGTRIIRYKDESDFSTEDEVIVQRPRRSLRAENDENNVPSESSLVTPSSTRRRVKRRVVVEEEEDEETNQVESIYDRVKRKRIASSETPTGSPVVERDEFGQFKSPKNKKKDTSENGSAKPEKDTNQEENGKAETSDEENNEEEEEEEEEDEDDETKTPRQYALRTRRNPVERLIIEPPTTSNGKPRFREETYHRPERRSRQEKNSGRSHYKRRMCRSDSSSTGDEDDREYRRSRADDARFERRKEISMFKARNRFVPVNLTEKDLSSSQSVIRERLRQTGASCSDIDPMSIDKDVSFQQVGGLGPHIQSLKEIVLFPLLYPDLFQQFKINPPKGVVFYGPPGTGKTLVARALANECSKGGRKVAFFMRKGADCLSKWVGESERQLRILFDQAYAMRPSIIFFDEIDGLAPVRSSKQDQIHASIVSTLLALMDGLDNRGEVIVIGATNRLDTLDPALRRPGRFDRELKFSLPDVAARKQILEINTSGWGDNKPSQEMLQFIADNSSGYCGADLKYLCTEAVLIALRSKYPYIYMTNDRLKLDMSSIQVEKKHIVMAMKRITPASRRDLSIPSRALDERTSILLSPILENVLANRIPTGYRHSQSVESTSSCELEKVVRALEEPPSVHAIRLILCGSVKNPDSGQTSYLLPCLLSRLDHLPVFSIAVSRLFSDGRPEEALSTIVQSCLSAANSGPCILLLPSIDQWYKVVPLSVAHMLTTALDQLTGYTSILFLATTDVPYHDCPGEVQALFRSVNCYNIPSILLSQRKRYFKFILAPAQVPPKHFDPSQYIVPEKADDGSEPKRVLTEKEAKELEKLYTNQLREFRIFLRDQLGRLVRDRRFNVFSEPVDEEEAEDYYQIIKEPMCLTDMMEKVDRREYNHPDQFLSDIKLIVTNALEYNPSDNLYGKTIRHNAVALRDMVEEYFDKEFDEDFVEKLEETGRLLKEANIVPKDEKLIDLPDGYVRKERWNVTKSFKGQNKAPTAAKTIDNRATFSSNNNRIRRFRKFGTYNFPTSQKKKKSAAIVKSIARSLSKMSDGQSSTAAADMSETEVKDESGSDNDEDECMEDEEQQVADVSMKKDKNVTMSPRMNTSTVKDEPKLLINEEKMDEVMTAAVQRTEDWPIPEMEKLAAELAHAINESSSHWDRRDLPKKLMAIVEEWEFDNGALSLGH